MFVSSLRPSVLKCVVRENRSNYQKVNNQKQFNSYMFTLQSLKQTGYELLIKQYSDIQTASNEYMSLMNPGTREHINELLGLKLNATQKLMQDTEKFANQFSQVVKARNRNKLTKGIKLKRPEDNEELTKEDLDLINAYNLKKSQDASRSMDCCDDAALQKPSQKFKPNTELPKLESQTSNPVELLDSKTHSNLESNQIFLRGFPQAEQSPQGQSKNLQITNSNQATASSQNRNKIEDEDDDHPKRKGIDYLVARNQPKNDDFDDEFH